MTYLSLTKTLLEKLCLVYQYIDQASDWPVTIYQEIFWLNNSTFMFYKNVLTYVPKYLLDIISVMPDPGGARAGGPLHSDAF